MKSGVVDVRYVMLLMFRTCLAVTALVETRIGVGTGAGAGAGPWFGCPER